jgi:spore coat protein JB
LHELQALGFALVELGEYLDTHPKDTEAFALFRSYAELYHKGRQEYEKMHGPLTQKDSAMQESYTWLKDPWPWDYAANEEGK